MDERENYAKEIICNKLGTVAPTLEDYYLHVFGDNDAVFRDASGT